MRLPSAPRGSRTTNRSSSGPKSLRNAQTLRGSRSQFETGPDGAWSRWSVPDYDGGSAILFYEIRLSTDGGTTYTDVHQLQVVEGDAGPWSYMIPDLPNDVAHRIRVVAHNLYGNGTIAEIGPITPRMCPHLVSASRILADSQHDAL